MGSFFFGAKTHPWDKMSTRRVGYIWYGALVMKWIHTNIKTHNHMRQEEVRLGVAKIDSFLICVLKKRK